MTFSAEGEGLVTSGWDRTVKVWLAAPLEEIATLQQDRRCAALATSPDQKILAIGNEDGTLRFFDTETAELRGELQNQIVLFALVWSPDTRLIATGHQRWHYIFVAC